MCSPSKASMALVICPNSGVRGSTCNEKEVGKGIQAVENELNDAATQMLVKQGPFMFAEASFVPKQGDVVTLAE